MQSYAFSKPSNIAASAAGALRFPARRLRSLRSCGAYIWLYLKRPYFSQTPFSPICATQLAITEHKKHSSILAKVISISISTVGFVVGFQLSRLTPVITSPYADTYWIHIIFFR